MGQGFFENFTEMIIDSNRVSVYEAYAIAWEAIRQKSIQIYASHWEDGNTSEMLY